MLRRQFRKNKSICSRKSTAGLTLIECLVAIVIIASTIATIGPMVVFSVATRVQNQKTEQAMRLAQAEIDKVRLIVEQGGDYGNELKDASLFAAADTVTAAVDVPAPSSLIEHTDSVTDVTQAKKMDADNDGDDDFAIQLFRTKGVEIDPETGTEKVPVAFEVGVRVYDARARGTLQSDRPAGLNFTSGEGERATRPLAVLYSQVAQGDRVGSLCQYWELTDETGSPPTGLSCD